MPSPSHFFAPMEQVLVHGVTQVAEPATTAHVLPLPHDAVDADQS
jgi:hypothetical protein